MYRFLFGICVGLGFSMPGAIADELPSAASRRLPADSPNVIAKFGVATRGDLLLIPVAIHGESHHFVLDTGATANVLHTPLAEKLSSLKPSSKKYPAGYPQMFQLPEATLAGSELSILGDAATFDLSALCRMSGYDIEGIVGMTSLEGRIVEIDFDRGSVTFLKSFPKTKSRTLSVGRDSLGRPTLDVEIQPGKQIPFIVDTGMSSPGIGELEAPLFDELLNADRIQLLGASARVWSVNGVAAMRKGRIDLFRLGEFEHRDLRITSGSMNGVGLRYLSRFKVVLDFQDNRALFVPGERSSDPSFHDASGMIMSRFQGRTIVDRVHPDGPASAADIRAGDIITHINGTSIENFSLFTIRQSLSHPGQTFIFLLKREDDDLKRQLVLKEWVAGSK